MQLERYATGQLGRSLRSITHAENQLSTARVTRRVGLTNWIRAGTTTVSSRTPLYRYLDEDDDPDVPLVCLMAQSLATTPPPVHVPSTRTAVFELKESLLLETAFSQSSFFLPDPDRPVGQKKYHDPEWMSFPPCQYMLWGASYFFVTDVSGLFWAWGTLS